MSSRHFVPDECAGVVDSREEFDRAIARRAEETYVFRLYVVGGTPQSSAAISNLKRICEGHLKGRYQLEVIDIYQQPRLAEGEQIIAAPTLIKAVPPPLRRFVGDLSNWERVLVGLDLMPRPISGEGDEHL
jgi:circadian clock protein KaiB